MPHSSIMQLLTDVVRDLSSYEFMSEFGALFDDISPLQLWVDMSDVELVELLCITMRKR